MMKLNVGACINVFLLLFFTALFSGGLPMMGQAKNVSSYSDLITDSQPLAQSNHTFTFTVKEDIPASGYIDITFPADFNLVATSSFGIRNVELYVNSVARASAAAASGVNDGVSMVTGLGGSIRYTFNSTTGASAEDILSLRVGNHTTGTIGDSFAYSTSTGTTTIPGDWEPVTNGSTTGTYLIPFVVVGGASGVNGEFSIALVESVGIDGVDTTETVPPVRFNGLPDGEIGGTTLAVEMSMETNEFAICKWSSTAGVAYGAMANTFTNTGFSQIVHSTIVPVTLEALNTYYIRCIDDEGNPNIDDFIIAFLSPPPPDGEPNAEGEVEGDGTGTGNSGTGGGTGSGQDSSGSDGEGNSSGSSGGSGGSGGGSGGGDGGDSGGDAGGGFESSDGAYRSGDAQVIINGYAYPGSTVYGLVDGAIVESETVRNDGRYTIVIEDIARGVYTFGVYAVDEDSVKSTTFSTSFTVTGGRTSSLSNINIMPSVVVNPDPVNPGETLTISGFAIPNATVTLENLKDGSSASQKTFTATSDDDGVWSVIIDTGSFSNGTYKVRAKAESIEGSVTTDYSGYTFYGVGQEAEGQINADLNTDGSVNLTDFSILLFWWGTAGGDSSPPADINGDGSVSLTDFSIMLFQWTG